MNEVAAALEACGLAQARVGVEMEYLPAGDFATLRGLLPKADFVAADGTFGKLRQVKTAREIDLPPLLEPHYGRGPSAGPWRTRARA